jgi:hypothetical protein
VRQRIPPPVNVTDENTLPMGSHELLNTFACSSTVAFVHSADGVTIGYPHDDPVTVEAPIIPVMGGASVAPVGNTNCTVCATKDEHAVTLGITCPATRVCRLAYARAIAQIQDRRTRIAEGAVAVAVLLLDKR